jgi:3-deoxy-D-manno-octulosonic-acid transferase
MYFFYSLLTAVAILIASPYFLIRGLRRPGYFVSLRQRFGDLPVEVSSGPGGAIWIHAVSVGEALAALPLARRLKQQFPDRRIVVSTTTATGQSMVRQRIDFADAVFYFPLDWAFAVRRAIRAVRPALVVILETEIWPNFLREARRAEVPVVFANARISDRSFRRYRVTNRLLFGFLGRVLSQAQFFLTQSEQDAARLRELGAPPEKVEVTGNLKYDSVLPEAGPLAAWLEKEVTRRERRPLIVAGSVTAHEESLVLIAFGILQGECRRALLVLAPRKPDRFDIAADLIEESHRQFVRRSNLSLNGAQLSALDDAASVVLLDSVGELASLYGIADAVFVGGSLVPDGGHNILEPASFGKPPLFGPSMENFREIAAKFVEAGAGLQVRSPEDLGVAWIELSQDARRREEMGRAARELVERNRGATDRSVEKIAQVLGGRGRAAQSNPGSRR